MAAFLEEIVQATRRKVAAAKASADVREMGRGAEQHVPRGFRRALLDKSKAGVAVIGELKKASPSKGLIRENFPVDLLARELESGELVQPFKNEIALGRYWLTSLKSKPQTAGMKVFQRWLVEGCQEPGVI